MLFYLRREGDVHLDADGCHTESHCESCFDITLSATSEADGVKRISVSVRPFEALGYELLVSYVVAINGTSHWIDRDLWRGAETVWQLKLQAERLTLGFGVDVIEVLAPTDLSEGTGYRNFRILSSKGAYYISPTALNELGGTLFADWYKRDCEGETVVVATELHEDHLDALLKSCCAYSSIVIHRKNFEALLPIAARYKIARLLRTIESYLLEAKSIHPVCKLDLAHHYKLAMLAMEVLRSLPAKHQRQEAVRDYLVKRKLDRCPVHLLELMELDANGSG